MKNTIKNNKKTIKGVIFDIDGVILDSMWIWDEVGARYLSEQGKNPKDNLRDVLHSLSLDEGAGYLKEEYGLEGTPVDICQGILALIAGFYHNEVQAKQGAREIMQYFASRKIPMTVASSSDREQITSALARLGLLGYMQVIITCHQLETSKRESRIYQKAAEHMGSKPQETLVIEDSLFALETAKKAGFLCAGVFDQTSAEEQEEIKKIGDWYAEDLLDLQKQIEEAKNI